MKYLLSFLLLWGLAFGAIAQTQTLRGRIIDKQARSPLPGASIFIAESNPVVGTTSDENGYYEIKGVPLGRVTVKISFIGYEEQTIPNVLITAGKQAELNLELTEQIFTGEEIVVRAPTEKIQTNNEFAVVSGRTFALEETSRYAGSRNDPARMASNFAGVSGANDARNDIIIRGNSPSGLLWRFEGVDIPSPNHFSTLGTTGGPVGMLNNNVLANSDFFTGAFPAEYGNATGGVFDIKMRNGNSTKREHLFQVGFAGFEGGAEGYFSKKSRATYLINYRYSTLAIFNAIGLQFGTGTAVPRYQDLSFKINIPTAKAGTFSIFGLGGNSNIDLLGSKEENPNPNDAFGNINEDARFKARMGVVGLKHVYFFGKNTFSEITLAASGSSNRGLVDSLARDEQGRVLSSTFATGVNFRQWRYNLRVQLNHKINARNTVSVGFLSDWLNVNLVDSTLNRNTGRFLLYNNYEGGTNLLRAYLQWQHRFSDRLTLNTGAHYQYFVLNQSQAIEPRIGLQYQVTPRQSLNFGFGIHHQLQPLQVYFQNTETAQGLVQSNRNLGFTQSWHYVLGYNNVIRPDLRLKVEAYYQSIQNAPVESTPTSFSMLNAGATFEFPIKNFLVNQGTGYNYGIEFTLEKFYSKGYYFLFTTSVFDSKYKGSDGIERNTAFNGNYVVNILGGREWKVRGKNAFFVDTKFTVAGGRRITPIDLAASNALGYQVDIDNQAFSEQLPAYLRWDVKVGYRINATRITQEIFLDVQNVMNRQNVLFRQYNRTTQRIGDNFQLGLFPVVQYRLTF